MKDVGDVLNTLEKDPEFKYFMLDAQGSLLDDYIKWRPEDEARIKLGSVLVIVLFDQIGITGYYPMFSEICV